MDAPTSPQPAESWPRGSPGYEEARAEAIWNKRLDRSASPDAIVRCTSEADVVEAVMRAGRGGSQVALRGSGHSYIAAPLRDEGLLLDLGGLDFIEIDADALTARVGPGARGKDLIAALEEVGLAFPIGHCSTVALGGYILSGGIGWNCGAWGAACHNIHAVELVTAAGERLTASETENADLLWAARGAGCGFFAAVTAYHLDLHPQPLAAWLWTGSFTAASAPVLADWLTTATAAADPSAEIMCLIGRDLHSGEPSITIRAVCTGQDEDEAAARVAAFRSPPKDAEPTGPAEERGLAFHELTRLSAMPDGKRVAADQSWSEAAVGDLLLAVVHLAGIASAMSTINIVSPGGRGRIPGIPELPGALSVGGGVSCGIYAMWDDEADDALHLDWVRQADAALAPFRTGRYIGEADLTAGPDRLAECFSAEALSRLQSLRGEWDPDGRFHGWPGA
jgi:FAD/FMN-containing dehydrogenase